MSRVGSGQVGALRQADCHLVLRQLDVLGDTPVGAYD